MALSMVVGGLFSVHCAAFIVGGGVDYENSPYLLGGLVPGKMSDWNSWSELMVLKNRTNHKDFVYCALPKTGATLWKQLMLRALGSKNWNSTNITYLHHPTASGLKLVGRSHEFIQNATDILERMGPNSNTFKATLVRDPATRMLHAYLSTCVEDNKWNRCRTGQNATFEDVVAAHESKGNDRVDPAFRNQTSFCGLQYKFFTHFDYIGQVEAFAHHSRNIVERARLWNTVGVSGWGRNHTQDFGVDFVDSVSEQMCKYYTPSLLKRVATLYWPDYIRFDYNIVDWFYACAEVWKHK